MQVKLSIHSKLQESSEHFRHPISTQQSITALSSNYELQHPNNMQRCRTETLAPRLGSQNDLYLLTEQTEYKENDLSEFSLIVQEGLQMARAQERNEALFEQTVQEYKNNIEIEKSQCEQLQNLIELSLIHEEKEQILLKMEKLRQEIQNISSCKSQPLKKPKPTRDIETADFSNSSQKQKPIKNWNTDQNRCQNQHPRVMTFTRPHHRSRSSRFKHQNNPPSLKNNVEQHRKILFERINVVKEYNRELLEGYLRRIQKMQFQNSLLKRQLNLIGKELGNVPQHSNDTKKRSYQHTLNRTPRFLSQNMDCFTTEKGKNGGSCRTRVFRFQRENSGNSKRSLSKYSCKSSRQMKSRAKSAYSNKITIDTQQKRSRHQIRPHTYVRGEYFELERKENQFIPSLRNS